MLFFPLCLIGYFGLNRLGKETLAQTFLLAMNFWFYGYFHVGYLVIMAASILTNYLFTLAMSKTDSHRLKKAEMILAVLLNLGVLFYYKYFNFFLGTVNQIFHTELTLRTILLPLGISFFTFQQISYVVDSYRGEVKRYPFLQYAGFVSYFPQLVAGPIVTHDELIPQFLDPEKKRFDWDNFAKGLYIFALGLSKKVLIADTFGRVAAWGFGDVSLLNTKTAIFVVLAYTLQIYFDFSGYSDMAVGLGKMMNIDLPENFNSPYKARSITEFWKRWHMTLTRFLTKYIYIPLGGNRKGTVRTYVNIIIVFLASGLWHGANYTFLVWGLLHGLLSVWERMAQKFLRKVPSVLSWAVTFGLINLTWIFFRADTLQDACTMISCLFRWDGESVSHAIAECFLLPGVKFLFQAISYDWTATNLVWLLPPIYAGGLFLALVPKNAYERMLRFRPKPGNLLFTALLLAWCVLAFSGISTFLYFNF